MTKIKSEKKNLSIFEKRTAAFKKLSPAQKRVAIAKDVLKQIKARQFIPKRGYFVDTTTQNVKGIIGDLSNTDSLQKVLPQMTCEVCALGGMFLSCTNLNNKATISALKFDFEHEHSGEALRMDSVINQNKKFSNGLNRFFSNYQLMLIETAFEEGQGLIAHFRYVILPNKDSISEYYFNGKWKTATPEILKAKNFSETTKTAGRANSTERMVAIMKNIIRNKGRFIP